MKRAAFPLAKKPTVLGILVNRLVYFLSHLQLSRLPDPDFKRADILRSVAHRLGAVGRKPHGH